MPISLVAALPHSGLDTVVPPFLWGLPFLALLLAIAVFPLWPMTAHMWEHNRNKLLVSVSLGLLVLIHYAGRGSGFHGSAKGAPAIVAVLSHAVLGDYVPFMALLASLYVIAGGLQLTGDLRGRPMVNTALLGLGTLLASLIVLVLGSKNPRLPGDHFQYVLLQQVGTSGRRIRRFLPAEMAEVFFPLVPYPSGFQPTAEPTAF